MKKSVFSFPLAVAPNLNRSGWLVWRLYKASLRLLSSPIFLLILFRLSSSSDRHPELSKCLVCSLVWVFHSAHVFVAPRCEPLDMTGHSSGPRLPGIAVTCFFVSLP